MTSTTEGSAPGGERAQPGGDAHPEGADLVGPSPSALLGEMLSLGRITRLEMQDEALAHVYISAMLRLFPGRLFALRLADLEKRELSLVYATGRLRPERRERLCITARALSEQGLIDPEPAGWFEVTDRYVPLFSESAEGFDIAMGDGVKAVGVLSVEYPPRARRHAADVFQIAPLALSLASALRQARLLRESTYLRDYLGKLVDHANAPIVVIGRRYEIRVVNRAVVSLTGFRRDELLGRDFVAWLEEGERARWLPVLMGALRGQAATGLEVRIPKKQGGAVRLLVNTASVFGAGGEVEGVIAMGRDLTEVRALEQRVIDAEKLASVGQLAAGVVHELNNPLTSIAVYSDYLLKQAEKLGEKPSNALKLQRIHESADRILRFSRELLAYARPTAEEPTPVDAGPVLARSVELCDHLLASHGVQVTLECAPELPAILGVVPQLQQVLVNLITNACHAMPEGAGQLQLVSRPGPAGDVELRISDNGSGISPDHLYQVFEPFFSTKGEGHGTGLGLPIVRNIVERHRGSIAIESQMGQGTTFILRFPAAVRGGSSTEPGSE